jgi:DNA-binding NtrC family response regulator
VQPLETCRRALAQFGGNKSAAARALGIPRSTLRGRLAR